MSGVGQGTAFEPANHQVAPLGATGHLLLLAGVTICWNHGAETLPGVPLSPMIRDHLAFPHFHSAAGCSVSGRIFRVPAFGRRKPLVNENAKPVSQGVSGGPSINGCSQAMSLPCTGHKAGRHAAVTDSGQPTYPVSSAFPLCFPLPPCPLWSNSNHDQRRGDLVIPC